MREYEPEPPPGPAWLTPVFIGGVALAVLLFGGRIIRFTPPEPVPASLPVREAAPATLADGTPPGEIPPVVEARFDQPVVMTTSPDELPRGIGDRCQTAPLASADEGSAAAFHHSALQGLVDEAQRTDIHLGPEALSSLAIGTTDEPPPGYPTTYQVSCVARWMENGWESVRPRIDFARPGDKGALASGGSGPVVRAELVEVPSRARWALHERPGWWVGYTLEGQSWLQVPVPRVRDGQGPQDSTRPRVVFLNDRGEVITDRRLQQSEAPTHAVDQLLDVGKVRKLLARVEKAPVHRCVPDGSLCVWVALVDEDLHALAAFGPHHLDTPPFGFVGYCPKTKTFDGVITGSRFSLDGRRLNGSAPRGLDRYAVRFSAGQVVVDLSQYTAGPPRRRADRQRFDHACSFRDDPIGNAKSQD